MKEVNAEPQKGIAKFINNIDYYLSVITLTFVSTITFILVITRYVFAIAAPGLEELNSIIFVWFLYFSIIYCTKENEHIRVGVLDLIFPRSSRITKLIADFIWLAFSVVMVYITFLLVQFTFRFQRLSTVLDIPWYLIYAVLPISFLIMTVLQVKNLWRDLKTPKSAGYGGN